MKVSIAHTVQVSDAQRYAIAAEIDGAGAKRRPATREEMKDFIWREGATWPSALLGDAPEPPDPADDDLVGGDGAEDTVEDSLADLVGPDPSEDDLGLEDLI